MARWLEELSQFNMEIQHRPGKKHTNADALSRIPGWEPCSDFNLRVKLQDLSCGGCPYCTRAHSNWSVLTRMKMTWFPWHISLGVNP